MSEKKIKKLEEKVFMREFINVYRSLNALWNLNSREYYDRQLKQEQNKILLMKYRERYPKANKYDVNRKINILRSNFKRELKRLKNLKNGKSTLWYFDSMSFIKDVINPLNSMSSNSNSKTEPRRKNDEMIFFQKEKDLRRKKYENLNVDSLQKTNESNPFEKATELWTLKLKKMSSNQALIAEKLINDIIFYGQMNYLNMESKINIESCTSSSSMVSGRQLECNTDIMENTMESVELTDSSSNEMKDDIFHEVQIEGPYGKFQQQFQC